MAFRMEKLTQKAQERAQDAGNPNLEPLHLLAGLLDEKEGAVGPVLENIGANRSQLERMVKSELGHLPSVSGGSGPHPSPDLMKVLEASLKEAETMRDEFVSTEHLLLALARIDTKAKNILKLNAIGPDEVLRALKEVRGAARVTDQNPEGKYQALQRYGIDLVERAKAGKLDPVWAKRPSPKGWPIALCKAMCRKA